MSTNGEPEVLPRHGETPAPRYPAMSMAEAHAILTAPGSPFETETVSLGGYQRRVWKHAPRSTREVLASGRTFGDRDFLIWHDERVTFGAFHRAVAALAADLLARGIQKGDRVAIAMRNLPEWPLAFYAASVAGAIVAPLNAWWSHEELIYALNDCGARFAFLDGERLERLRGGPGASNILEHVYVCRAGPAEEEVVPLETIVGSPSQWSALADLALPGPELEPEDDATIFYTSGTTGEPKGALATHRNMLSNITGAACGAARVFLRRGAELPQPDPAAPQAGSLMAIPFFHVTGTFAILSPALHSGHKLVLMHRWDPEEAMRLIERERLTWIVGVPTIAWDLAEHPAKDRYDLSSLVSIGYGGAAAAPELVRRLGDTMPDAVPGHGWGMTETSGLAATHSAEDYLARPTSCGAPVPVVDMRIADPETGRDLPIGDVGELMVAGPNVIKGYWNKPQETAAAFVDGWVKTGDLARLDEDGFLYIVDRAKDMLIRGGENIFCIEVENALLEHSKVIDAAVVGIPHATLGEEPAAVVRLKDGEEASPEELRAHIAARLAAYKVPVDIRIIANPLPRNAAGKVLKGDLKQLFAR